MLIVYYIRGCAERERDDSSQVLENQSAPVSGHLDSDDCVVPSEPDPRAGQRFRRLDLDRLLLRLHFFAIAAVGQTLVIQQGGHDLTVPGVMSLAAVRSQNAQAAKTVIS
jgi:hypothetical protein